jgi:outer membrane protein assembly factor BamA
LTFGAGVSQYEGVFGQLAFQTSNFLGRGESLTVQVTAGDRSQNFSSRLPIRTCSTATSPGGFDVFKRSLDYIGYYTQKSSGGNLMVGVPDQELQPHVPAVLVRVDQDQQPERSADRSVVSAAFDWLSTISPATSAA